MLNVLLAAYVYMKKPLWLVCKHCLPMMHAQVLEKSLWLFCSISESSSGSHLGMFGVQFRDQVEFC